ncbi:hypothetical protein QP166_15155 [Sphingomonas sp. LR60]|uniref:hypothetical protein n=1 Tax=Sphingomonas sp. LR60 TaxID=3050233 RepID=UPI002FDFCE67
MSDEHDDQSTNGSVPALTDAGETLSRGALESIASMKPAFRHSLVGGTLAHSTTGTETMEWKHVQDAYVAECTKARDGDLGAASNMLTAQALTLDAVFTEMLSRATKNVGRYPDAMDRYMRLALKAQAQSRATLEALAKIHQPREQTVKHVHIDNRGGQAVVAENLHARGAKTDDDGQSYGPTYASTIGATMLGQDAAWHGVPVPGDARPQPLPHSRGQSRRTEGQ